VCVIGTVFAFYLNHVVTIVLSFLKVTELDGLAPKQTEPTFLIVQLGSLLLLLVLGTLTVKRFHMTSAKLA
jgi:uncharacterized membrane protein YhaH (DUF805 family)